MKKKVLLLTGAAGFLGKNLLKHFVTYKNVIAIDYNKKNLLKLKKSFKDYSNKVDFFPYDITKRKDILKIKNSNHQYRIENSQDVAGWKKQNKEFESIKTGHWGI